jgi:hypothetical protein
MSDLVRMSPEDFDDLSQQMRLANTQRLKAVLDALEPYVEGLGHGGVSPAHVNAYVKTVRELGLLWKAYDRPAAVTQEEQTAEVELMILAARQEAALESLRKLREVGMKEQARRAS